MSKVQTAFRLVREGRWGDFAAVIRAKVEPRVRRGELELNRLSGGRLFKGLALDTELRRPPGMVSLEQRRFLHDYAQREFTGAGGIVDLGCWLGSSTLPLVVGLDSNPNAAARDRLIFAYDLFRWNVDMDSYVKGTPFANRYRDGDDFQDAFLHYVSPWRDRIELRPGDLGALGWSDGPIEFLFVDAMKSWELADIIPRRFFVALIPGVSLVLHHDFAHYYTPWIPLLMHRLRDYLVAVRPVPRAAALFRATAPIPAELLEHRWSVDDFGDAGVDEAFSYAAEVMGPEGLAELRVSKLMLRLLQGDLERAVSERDAALRDGKPLHDGFRIFESELEAALAKAN